MKITINNQELEFKFRFKQIAELTKQSGKDLTELEAYAKDLSNIPTILSIGTGIEISQAEQMLDESDFTAVSEVITAFSTEVVRYLDPNSQSQTN